MKSGTQSNLRCGVCFQIVPKLTSLVSHGVEFFLLYPSKFSYATSVLSFNFKETLTPPSLCKILGDKQGARPRRTMNS